MNAQGTPGPWAVNPLQLNQICTLDGSHEVAMATIYHPASITVHNARKLAAAPEMFDLLNEFQTAYDAHDSAFDVVSWARRIGVVLHKATEPVHRYCVDGREFDDPQSSYAGDGQFPPFVVFDIEAQQNLPGHYATRAQAEAALAKVQP